MAAGPGDFVMRVSRKLNRRSFLSAIIGVGAVASVGKARAYQDQDSGPGADPVGVSSHSSSGSRPDYPSEEEYEALRQAARSRCIELRRREAVLRAELEATPAPTTELRAELEWVREAILLSCRE